MDTLRVVALIPVKSLEFGKARLADALDLEQRIQLTEETLRRLIHVLSAEPRVTRIAVVTSDAHVIAWLAGRPVEHLTESGHGLNDALREARTQLSTCDALLVLPADLAAITLHDVAAIIDAAECTCASNRCIVIAPDRHDHGTNALLLRPPDVIDFAFGTDSAHLHAAAAAQQNAHVHFYRSDSIGLDLDLPEDYDLYTRQW